MKQLFKTRLTKTHEGIRAFVEYNNDGSVKHLTLFYPDHMVTPFTNYDLIKGLEVAETKLGTLVSVTEYGSSWSYDFAFKGSVNTEVPYEEVIL